MFAAPTQHLRFGFYDQQKSGSAARCQKQKT
jgi:hypothetical protein